MSCTYRTSVILSRLAVSLFSSENFVTYRLSSPHIALFLLLELGIVCGPRMVLTSPVGSVREGTDEERNVVVVPGILDRESDLDERVE